MKNWLNFGVSDPLTLGMAHPIADRLETLGRARPVTKRSRAMALGLIGAAAMLTAPITIAADHPDKIMGFNLHIDGEAMNGQSYEIVDEDGEKKAYRLLEGGERQRVDLQMKEDGSYQLTYEDGQTVDIPNIDLDGLDSLKSLEGLKALEGLKSLEGLKALEGLKGLEGLSALSRLEGLSELKGVSRIILKNGEFESPDFPENVKIVVGNKTIDVAGDGGSLDDDSRTKIQEFIRGAMTGRLSGEDGGFEWLDELKFGENGDVRRFILDRKDGAVLNDTIISGSSVDAFSFDPAPEFYEDVDAEIEALMADSSVDIRTRKAKARRMKAGALQAEFRRNNPAATTAQKVENCVAILDRLNRDYRYHNQTDRGESAQVKCERSNVSVRSSFVFSSTDETQ
jgi:hypothetical protein